MADGFDVVFHGDSKSECIDFIRAVRKYAKQNKRILDNQWIADELYDAFDGEALTWYVCLPVDVRRYWERLQQALVTRWIKEVNDDDVASLAAAPRAAAAPPACPPNLTPPGASPPAKWVGNIGRIRIRCVGIDGARYLAKNGRKGSERSGAFEATTEALALKVRVIMVASDVYRLELVEYDSLLSVLAAFNYYSDDWNDASCWGLLIGVDAPGQGPLKTRRTTYGGSDSRKTRLCWTETWKIEDAGILKLRGPDDTTDTARFLLGMRSGYEDFLWFIGPKASPISSVMETNLEFEPLEK